MRVVRRLAEVSNSSLMGKYEINRERSFKLRAFHGGKFGPVLPNRTRHEIKRTSCS